MLAAAEASNARHYRPRREPTQSTCYITWRENILIDLTILLKRPDLFLPMTKLRQSVVAPLALATCLYAGVSPPLAASSLLSDGGPASMEIDILPGNPQNTIDLGRQRLIPIAIFGTASLDVNDLNPRTLSLEAVSQNLVGKSDKSLCRQEDLNGDARMDLVCQVKTIGYRVQQGDIEVTISAGTYQRQSLRAQGMLRYVVE